MLRLTASGGVRTGAGMTRRDFLQVGALGGVGLSLADWMGQRARGSVKADPDDRSVIMIFNLGGPSQLDTWDMKPDAPAEIRGPFKPIATASGDIQISELFPLHAKCADRFSIVRSCHHSAASVHDTGHQLMQTGRLFANGLDSPHAGCVASFLRERQAGRSAHVLLPAPMGYTGGNLPHGQDAACLGRVHDPLTPSADPAGRICLDSALPDFSSLGEVSVDDRRGLRDQVDGVMGSLERRNDPRLQNGSYHAAYRVLTAKRARAAFDVSQESSTTRDRYGRTRFGQSCLMARRLVEAGVGFVTINTFTTVFNEMTWDIHGTKPFTSIGGMRDIVAPMYDAAYAALLDDLTDRGLLDNTLVCCLAEFGRTPRINSAGGRDHWPQCWSVYFAGGGVKGGRVVGQSDRHGGCPVDRPVTPAEVVATIYHSLGFDLETSLPGPEGGQMPLVEAGTRPIEELF